MSRGDVSPSPTLTPEQRKLFDDERGLAEEAVRVVVKALGAASFRHLSRDEMLSIATIGAMTATTTFDPAAGPTFRTWGLFAAVREVIHFRREENARYVKMRALIRAKVLVYLGSASAAVEIGVDTDTTLAGKLRGFTNPVLGLALLEAAAYQPQSGGEDELAEREAAVRAGDALRQVLPSPGSAERKVLDMHFVEGKPLTEVAAAMGVDERGYRTFVRRFHEVFAGLREGLEKRGIREMPPWREEDSGHALGEGK